MSQSNQPQTPSPTATPPVKNSLPSGRDLSRLIREAGGSSDQTELDKIKRLMYTMSDVVADMVDGLEREEHDESIRREPEEIYHDLLRAQVVTGGLLGLCETLIDRIEYLKYKELDVENKGKEKKEQMSQGDRKFYAEAARADLNGFKKTLEVYGRTLDARIQPMKYSGRIR